MTKKKGMGWRGHLFSIVGLVCAVLFMPTSMVIAFGMLPTLAANLIDKSIQKSRAISVGMMNFAGTMPFLLELWLSASPNSMDTAINIIIQPKTGIIIYLIAAAGYGIEAAVTGMVATVMQQRAALRLRTIELRKKELVDRWDDYVDGETQLDDFGFPKGHDD